MARRRWAVWTKASGDRDWKYYESFDTREQATEVTWVIKAEYGLKTRITRHGWADS